MTSNPSQAPQIAVLVFPGSNDDRDAQLALEGLGADPVLVWHADEELPEVGGVVLPGGFSYGDYLRAGAIARFSPAMRAVADFAADGGFVLGICNGFQVLCEAGLLPGALRPNESLSFVCRDVALRVERQTFRSSPVARSGSDSRSPSSTAKAATSPTPSSWRSCRRTGRSSSATTTDNPNGSIDDIAGVVNAEGNVMGLMPHPEHAVDPLLGSADGALILSALVERARERLLAPA